MYASAQTLDLLARTKNACFPNWKLQNRIRGFRMDAGQELLTDTGYGGIDMPFVNIKITKEGATPDQKAQVIKGVTQVLVDVLGKNPQTTVVVIDEVETDNWGIDGEKITVRRKKAP